MNQLRNFSVTERDKLNFALFLHVLGNRLRDVYVVRGRSQGITALIFPFSERRACHLVLVDCKKRQQFHEQIAAGSIDVGEFGIVIESAWARDAPQYFNNMVEQFHVDLTIKPVLVKLQKERYEQIYYIVSDVAGENNFMLASSEDDIRRIGRILYCTRDEDPAESFCEIIEKVYLRLAKHISPNDNEIFDSVRNGELQRMRTYLAGGGDVNYADEYGRSLLHLAVHSKNLNMIRFLKDKGANIHAEDKMCGRKPVHIAAKEGHQSIVSFFLENGISVNECDKINWTPLHYAVWKGDLETIKFLIEQGANINAKENYAHKKPIHIAAEHAYVDVIQYLLANGANIEDRYNRDRTPLVYSVQEGHFETSNFLIGEGADTNVKSKEGRTLLHAATFGDNKEIIEFLVEAGLNINERDSNGSTPLHYAVGNNKLKISQVLADLGADLFAVGKDGKNPLAWSKKKGADMVLHIVYRMCKKLQEEGKYNDAVKLYNDNLEVIKTLRTDNPEYLEIQNKIAVMLYEMGHYDKAETTFKNVLRNREKCLRSNHSDTLCTKHSLALVYVAQIRYTEAMKILKEVFETREAILGKHHDDTLNVSRDIGNVHFKKGEYDEALEMFKHVFEMRNTYFGSDHLKTLQSRQDMAVIFVNKGEFEKALQMFKDVLMKREILLGKNHPDTLSTIYHVKLTSEKIKDSTPEGQCSIS